jgi:hypothetical protein
MPWSRAPKRNNSSATLGFEAKFSLAADKRRTNNPTKAADRRRQCSGVTSTRGPQGGRNQAHQFGLPPRGNANFAWVQYFTYHLALFSSGLIGRRRACSCEETGDTFCVLNKACGARSVTR